MEDLPLVSLITPSLNQGRFLEETILSILNQDYPNIQYIIMDGGSTDNTLQIIHQYSNSLDYWESCPDRGQAHAINKGLKRASGVYLGWVNADDILLPKTISDTINHFIKYPEIDVMYGRLERISNEGLTIPTPTLPKDRLVFNKQLVLGECIVNQPGSLWRRAIMEEVGLLNEDLKYSLDYEYWIRLALGGARFMRLPKIVAKFRISDFSKTVNQTAAMALEQLDVLNNFHNDSDLPQKTGLPKAQLENCYKKGRGIFCFYICWGLYKRREYRRSIYWFKEALLSDPLIIFRKRWFDLLFVRLLRLRKHFLSILN
jgi:glycosyltransferase involved in cell wall biosynthesis